MIAVKQPFRSWLIAIITSTLARTPSEYACTLQRTEKGQNGIMEAPTHHPNAAEDQTAKIDDSARVNGERLG